ncbi:GtrA family protein [candidate division WWE3 bacterium]|uniref:GtrA family protein n=1 Tax=candidate division WWE3 bacterium TaxID=2053526 RepID=A0A7X9DLF8_UNCKA|nr:GtrA family protein [candidate division WWE3 bacterium]
MCYYNLHKRLEDRERQMDTVMGLTTLLIRRHRRKLMFLAIGGTLYCLNAGLQYWLTERLLINPAWTNVYVTVFLYILQFVLNAIFTWGDRTATFVQNLKRVGKYIPIKIVVWGINTAVDLFLLSLGLHYQLANAIAVLMIMVVNYFVFDRIIFTK